MNLYLQYCKLNSEEYLLNVLDSPGHIDFGGEVSTAVRLSDGALILVDVVEGICSQTQALIRQAWKEEIRPILILNKIDRLITDLKLTPAEAFRQLQLVLEKLNSIAGDFFVTKQIQAMERLESEKNPELLQTEFSVY